MRIGPLRHRITLQARTLVQNPATGEMVPTWTDWAKVWARIDYLSARDLIAAQAVQSKITARIVIRYRPGVLATMRILHRGKIYSLEGALPDNKSGVEYLTLPVSEGVRDG